MGSCFSTTRDGLLDGVDNDLVFRALAITGGHFSRRPSLPTDALSAVEDDFPFLIQALGKLLIFDNLPHEKQVKLCANMYSTDVAAGEILIREGEEGVAASELYIVKSGDFEVLQKHKDVNVRVNRKQAGDIFGEVSLLYSSPRNATVVALTDSSVWVLPRNVFNYHVREDSRSFNVQLDIFLNSVNVIQPLNKDERSKLIEYLQEETFEAGQTVCKKGDVADKFYIIMKGEATILNEVDDGKGGKKEAILTELFSGEFFGEESLAPAGSVSNGGDEIEGNKGGNTNINTCNYTVKASEEVGMHCLTVPVEKADIIRPLYEMMQREKKPELLQSKYQSMKNVSKDVPCPILIKELDPETGKYVVVSRCRGHLYEASKLRDSNKSVMKKPSLKSSKDRFQRNSVDEGYIASFNAYRRRSSTRSVSSDGSSDSNKTEDLGSLLTDSFYSKLEETSKKIEASESFSAPPPALEEEGKEASAQIEMSSPSVMIQEATEEDVQEFGLVLFKGGVLGSGAFSVVFVVQEERSKRKFAMKRIPKSSVENCRSHILCEQKITRSITHPYVIRQYASFQDKKYLYFLFDYLPSGDLMDVLCGEAKLMKISQSTWQDLFRRKKRENPSDANPGRVLVGVEEKLAKFYVAQIVLVLEYLHKNGIVYRDLKPENVLVDRQGFVKLGDFGFAKNLKRLPNEQTYTFCGTPGYVAPENVFTKGYGYSVDYWSLGVLAYVMLTGKQPFNQPKTSDPMVVVRRIVDPDWDITFPPYVTPLAKDFINQLLQRDLKGRLGCREGGIQELKNHKWFSNIPWDLLEVKKYKPHRMPAISKRRRKSVSQVESPDSQVMSFDSETKKFFVEF